MMARQANAVPVLPRPPEQAISTRSVGALSQASCRTFRVCAWSTGSQKSGQRTQRASQVTAGSGRERPPQAAAPDEPAGWQPQHASAGRVPWAGHQATLGKGRKGRLATRNRAADNARCALVAADADNAYGGAESGDC